MGWTQLAITVVGSGFGTTVVGFIFKQKLDRELEIQKAFLARASHVHERQIDALIKLYGDLYKAQGFFKRLAAGSRFADEMPDDEYRRLLHDAITSANDKVVECRLLIPPELAQQCDEFFKILFGGQIDLNFAHQEVIVDGHQRAKFSDSARNTAFKKIPNLLEQIEKVARSLIHDEPGAPPSRS